MVEFYGGEGVIVEAVSFESPLLRKYNKTKARALVLLYFARGGGKIPTAEPGSPLGPASRVLRHQLDCEGNGTI